MRRILIVLAALLLAGSTPALTQDRGADATPAPIPLSMSVVGGVHDYVVVPGDTLTRIGARLGVPPATIAAANRLPESAPLRPGQQLLIDNRHIVPAAHVTRG